MKVPLNWLRDYVSITSSLKGLADKLTMSGNEVKGIKTIGGNDALLDLEVTPNRPDCLSVIGIAREIAALTGQRVNLPLSPHDELGANTDQFITVEVADPDLCPRYCASLIERVKVAPSPFWMQQRLTSCGMHPINNIVDITNYVMLEYGQPLHAFDYHCIRGGKLLVRRAHDNEVITTLDGVTRTLTSDMLAIANSQYPLAIAGVMGGIESEMSFESTSVLLESANFNSPSIRRTSKNLRLSTEASSRFERGIPPELTIPALKRATQLILEIGSGKAAKGVVDIYPNKKDMSPILLSLSQVKHLLGMELSLEEIKKGLLSLGFECQIRSPSELQATPPYWRTDVKSAADVVEEVARIIGYDRIPLTLLSSPLPKLEPDPILALREKVRDILASCGFQEVISYSLTSREKLARISPQVKPLRVVNPMSREQEYLRTTLRANLLTILSSNQKHEENGIRLFEIGKIYLPQEKSLPQEREMLAAVLSGPRTELSWFNGEGYLGFFDAKGVVETLLGRLGVEADFRLGGDESLHPGRTAIVTVEGNPVGVIGELHPGIAKSFDLSPFPVALLKIELDRLLPLATKAGKYHPLPRFPTSTRDIAIVVDAEVSAKKIQGIISASPLVSQVTLFDLYTGEQVPPGKKSLAFRVVYQSPTHTLVEEEVHQVEREILAKLYGELGATLRG